MQERDRWSVWVAGVAIVCWSLGLGGLTISLASGSTAVSWPDFAIALAYPAVALLVSHVREARRWSALTLMSALFSGLNVASSAWADRLYRQHIHPTPGASWAAWLAGWTWVVSVVGFIAVAYFPDGRLPSRRWAAAPAAVVAAGLTIVIGNAFAPRIDNYQIPSPLPGPHITSIGAVTGVVGALALAGIIGCLAGVVVKFRRSGPVARRQIGWYAYGYAVTAVVLVVAIATNLPSALLAIGPVTVATGAAIAILKLRLYDIDRIVNRTLAWGLLTALVIALYVISVGFFERSFDGGGSIGGLLATAIVAVAFQPLRISVQRAVNQLIYGNRDQPEVVFRELAATLDSETGTADPLATLAGTLARSLRLRAVVLDVDGGSDLQASYASDPAQVAGLVEVAAAQTGGTRIRVRVRPRGPGGVSARDRQLVASLAPSLVAAAEALRLRHALETARLRAVSALAEEQRRTRRDLHDGLGPVLAGLRLTIGTARRILDADPAGADRMLADAQADALAAMDDVRRLAHDLRPPSLDELGLTDALRDRLDRLVEGSCELCFDAGNMPDPLPAAVEVAAYRIGCEAVLNAVRHAAASACTVTLRGVDGGLALTVRDDGRGLPDNAEEHVGLRSMRERAEELGGTIHITGAPGSGTTVGVWLPCVDGSVR